MQMCYFIATLGRSGVQVNFDLWLPSEEEMREKNPSGKSFVLQLFISGKKNIFPGKKRIFLSRKVHRAEDSTAEQKTGQ